MCGQVVGCSICEGHWGREFFLKVNVCRCACICVHAWGMVVVVVLWKSWTAGKFGGIALVFVRGWTR